MLPLEIPQIHYWGSSVEHLSPMIEFLLVLRKLCGFFFLFQSTA